MLPCTERGGEKGISCSRGQVSVLGRSLATRESRERGMAPGNGVGGMAATVREKGEERGCQEGPLSAISTIWQKSVFPF